MRVKADCIPCYLNQVLSTLNHGRASETEKHETLANLAGEIKQLKPSRTPSYNSTLILTRCCEMMGVPDPFAAAKAESNQAAVRLVEKFASVLKEDPDPLAMALKLAVAGNVIDLGIQLDYDIYSSVRDALKWEFDRRDYLDFVNTVKESHDVLIVGDNAGEIVFDGMLVKVLTDMGKSTVYTVKKFPILNDATMLDAEETGMTSLTRVIDNGNGFLGTEWSLCSPEFKQAFTSADLVVAKGQANYESMEGTAWAGEKTFFLLKAKCQVVASHLGVSLGAWILRRNQPASR
jgi:uncharacterized protein with ATP-grasp and redox domains